MEVSISHMARDRRDQPRGGNVLLGSKDGLRQPRYWHTDIRRYALCTRSQSYSGRIGAMSCRPQPVARLGSGCPNEAEAFRLLRDAFDQLRLLLHACGAAVEFKEQ